MLWSQSPGRKENERKLEMVGAGGEFLWDCLSDVGLKRSDFDIQYVLRCRPVDKRADGDEHKPTTQELKCCSVFNEEALDLNAREAGVHLILGEIAGKQLLGNLYRKDRPIFWHEGWEAKVVVAPHPNFLIKIGGKGASWYYQEFKDRLRAVRLAMDYPGEWGYLKAQNYGSVESSHDLDELLEILYQESKAKRRISVDIEDGLVDEQKKMLMIGFGWGHFRSKDPLSWTGGARSVILHHPEFKHPERVPKFIKKLRSILSDAAVSKIFQHGSYDVPPIEEMFDVKLKGYDFDTQYGSYLKNSNLRVYNLDAIAYRSFPEFAGYKDMMRPYSGNYANTPLPLLTLYNCADCDLTKRIEVRTAPYVSAPLVKIYIHDAIVLDGMEERGPILDWKAHKRVADAIPKLMKKVHRKLCQIAGDPDFNPGAPEQVAWLIFDKLKLAEASEENGRSTKAEVLETVARETGHKAPTLVLQYRTLHTMKSTFLDGWARSAKEHDGELRTIWWLTGAATGRLRSGKGEAAEALGIVNFQNLHGNPLLKNMLVSDVNWRLALGDTDEK